MKGIRIKNKKLKLIQLLVRKIIEQLPCINTYLHRSPARRRRGIAAAATGTDGTGAVAADVVRVRTLVALPVAWTMRTMSD